MTGPELVNLLRRVSLDGPTGEEVTGAIISLEPDVPNETREDFSRKLLGIHEHTNRDINE